MIESIKKDPRGFFWVRIPEKYIKNLDLKEGDKVDIKTTWPASRYTSEGISIIIKKKNRRK